MKTIVEASYRENGSTCFPVMSYDEDADIDERTFTRIGTISVRDGAAIGDIIDAISAKFPKQTDRISRLSSLWKYV